MATITTIDSTDLITDSRSDINTNFANLNSDKIETSYIDTDTAMAANSDVKIPSQKAVKSYIDTQGGANASETVRGVVEEATDAEVTAGTATGATGAKLFVSPAKLDTRLDALINTVNFFQQTLALQNVGGLKGAGSNQSGSILITYTLSTNELTRWVRDTNTGMYIITHNVSSTIGAFAGVSVGIVVLGSYTYVFADGGVNTVCYRYDLDTLANEALMTFGTAIPNSDANGDTTAWTDGTYIYVTAEGAPTSVRKISVSGTTFTQEGTATGISNLVGGATSSFFDGTYPYIWNQGADDIKKLTTVDGSVGSTTEKLLGVFSDTDSGAIAINIDASRMYIGKAFVVYDEAAATNTYISLIPVSKP